jgi:spore germination protein
MFTRIVTVSLLALLTIGLVGTGYWGYQEHQDKNTVLIKAENSYQRAFHDLNNNIGNLEDELGKSIAINSRKLMAPCLTNIWRLAYTAQSNVGQLPLTMMSFAKTEEFLADIADYTYDIGMRDLDNEPLTDKEWNRLKTLHGQAEEIESELRKVQTKVLDQGLRWMDVEMAVASENSEIGQTITDGFEGLDEQVQGYIETEGGATDNKLGNTLNYKREAIEGSEITEEQVRQKVKKFLKLKGNAEMEVSKNGEGKGFLSYGVRIKLPDRENKISLEISRKGGHILWLLDSRDIEKTDIGLNKAQNKALAFLKERGITSMESIESNQYDNVGVFDFVYQKDDVRIYTDLIRVKVALDNGDIIGYEALDYVVAHDEKIEVPTPAITLEEAKSKVNKHLTIHETHLSMLEIKAGEVKLCYELLGTIGNETYRIFVNAETGDEEKIEMMKQAEPLV